MHFKSTQQSFPAYSLYHCATDFNPVVNKLQQYSPRKIGCTAV